MYVEDVGFPLVVTPSGASRKKKDPLSSGSYFSVDFFIENWIFRLFY